VTIVNGKGDFFMKIRFLGLSVIKMDPLYSISNHAAMQIIQSFLVNPLFSISNHAAM